MDQMDSASDPDEEYINFLDSFSLRSTCNILSNESSKPFYSYISRYNKPMLLSSLA